MAEGHSESARYNESCIDEQKSTVMSFTHMQYFFCEYICDECRDTEQAMLAMCRHDSINYVPGPFNKQTRKGDIAVKLYSSRDSGRD